MLRSPYFFFLHMESFHQFSWADMPQQAAAQYRYPILWRKLPKEEKAQRCTVLGEHSLLPRAAEQRRAVRDPRSGWKGNTGPVQDQYRTAARDSKTAPTQQRHSLFSIPQFIHNLEDAVRGLAALHVRRDELDTEHSLAFFLAVRSFTFREDSAETRSVPSSGELLEMATKGQRDFIIWDQGHFHIGS